MIKGAHPFNNVYRHNHALPHVNSGGNGKGRHNHGGWGKGRGRSGHNRKRGAYDASSTTSLPPNSIMQQHPQRYPRFGHIVGVQFEPASKQMVDRLSVVTCDNQQLYKKHVVDNRGANDSRMGTTDEFQPCRTCGLTTDCPGHMGKIELRLPCFSVEMLNRHLFKILRITCWNCCRCLVRSDNASFRKIAKMADSKKRMTALTSLADRIRVCGQYTRHNANAKDATAMDLDDDDEGEGNEEMTPCAVDEALQKGCGAHQPVYEHDGILVRAIFSLSAEHDPKSDDIAKKVPVLGLDTIYETLSLIPEEDLKLMGFDSRPEDQMFSSMAHTPPQGRPSIARSVGSHVRGQADTTKAYGNIQKKNKELAKYMNEHPDERVNLAVYEYQGFKHTDPSIVIKYAKQYDACGPNSKRLQKFVACDGGTKKTRKRRKLTKKQLREQEEKRQRDQQNERGDEVIENEETPQNNAIDASDKSDSGSGRRRKRGPNSSASSDSSIMARFIALQVAVAQFQDSEAGKQYVKTATHSRQIRGLFQIHTGKYGRIRKNQTGRRGALNGRSVITPDICMDMDEVGVPESFCKILVRTERVTMINIRVFTNMVRRGEIDFVTRRSTGELVDLQMMDRSQFQLEYGDLVERPLQNGDPFPFCRQPSLHKMSMMTHRVVIMNGSTYRIHASAMEPYNADCDGDEMNGYAVNGEEARGEAHVLMPCREHIVAAAASKPIMSFVQDGILGLYMLTRRDQFLDRRQVMQLMVEADLVDDAAFELPAPAIRAKKRTASGSFEWVEKWTGKQLFSMLLPRDYLLECNVDDLFEKVSNTLTEKGAGVIIRNGELLYGRMRKNVCGNVARGLVQTLFRDYGSEFCKNFLSRAQRLASNLLMITGVTVSASDCHHPNLSRSKEIVQNALEWMEQFPSHEPKHAQKNDLAISSEGANRKECVGSNSKQTEELIVAMGARARDFAGEHILQEIENAIQTSGERNGFHEIVDAGAKGSIVDEVQVHGLLGQQNEKSSRLSSKLPHFKALSQGKRHGFVENSFFSGLSGVEYFHHAYGGREGLVDTSCKTAKTGYIANRLCKGMKDHVVRYDGTVRNTSNQIIEFAYGDDGFDASRLIISPLRSLKMGRTKLREMLCVSSIGEWFGYMDEGAHARFATQINELGSERVAKMFENELDRVRRLRDDWRQLVKRDPSYRWNYQVHVPIDFERLMKRLTQLQMNAGRFQCDDEDRKSNVTPIEVQRTILDRLDAWMRRRIIGTMDEFRDQNSGNNPENSFSNDPENSYQRDESLGTRVESRFGARNLLHCIFEWMATARLLREHRITADELDWCLAQIEEQVMLAQVPPGEAVGELSGSSIGERGTQMMLKTFHAAGEASALVGGVPRVNELLNASENQKTPSLRIPVCTDAIQRATQRATQRSTSLHQECDQIELERRYVESLAKAIVSVHMRDFMQNGIHNCIFEETFYDATSNDSLDLDTLYTGPNQKEVGEHLAWMRKHWSFLVPLKREARAEYTNHVMYVHLSREKCVEHRLTMQQMMDAIRRVIGSEHLYFCTRARHNHWIIRIRFFKRSKLFSNVRQTIMKRNSLSGAEMDEMYEGFLCRRMAEIVVEQASVCGTDGIRKAIAVRERIVHVNAEDELETGYRWVISTEGSNLKEIARYREFSFAETTTNNVHEVQNILGIAAAETWIEREHRKVLDQTGSDVNARHLKELANTQTERGYVTPMTRNGISKQDVSVLKCVAFERPMEWMANAAVWKQFDPVRGPTESLFVNNPAPLGTGTVDLRNCNLTTYPQCGFLVPEPHVAFLNDVNARKEEAYVPELSRDLVRQFIPERGNLANILGNGKCRLEWRMEQSALYFDAEIEEYSRTRRHATPPPFPMDESSFCHTSSQMNYMALSHPTSQSFASSESFASSQSASSESTQESVNRIFASIDFGSSFVPAT